MKLFYKFLISALAISLIPLVVYTIILLNTTAVTLKGVIDQNNINSVDNIVREVNNFFIELDAKLDVARRFERTGKMSRAEKTKILLTEMSDTKMFSGFFLLDKNWKSIIGMTFDEALPSIVVNEELMKKTDQTKGIELGSISHTSKNRPYIDIVYPIDTSPREYLYLRVTLEYVLEKINPYLKAREGRTSKTVSLIDGFGALASTTDTPIHTVGLKQLAKYRNVPKNRVFVENNKVNIIASSRGPGWLVLFQEPTIEAYASVREMQLISLALICLSACFAFFGAFRLAKNLTNPMKTLISGIEIVASGNLEHQVTEVSKDELAKVATAFNSMTVKLKELQEDIKKSERLSAIGQMANVVGHEIRNPLSAITNAVYLIRLRLSKVSEIDSKTFRYIEIIEDEIKSTDKIINDMLGYSRDRDPVLVKKNINEVISGIMEESVIPENIKLQMNLTPEIPEVSIDVEEIKQVIRNLVNNAIDSMNERQTGIIMLRTSKTYILPNATSPDYVCLEISDTGCGIPPDKIDKIFEPFFSTKSKGTGLGLAVVKRIIQQRHKGIIEIKSDIGKGTTFYIKLPV